MTGRSGRTAQLRNLYYLIVHKKPSVTNTAPAQPSQVPTLHIHYSQLPLRPRHYIKVSSSSVLLFTLILHSMGRKCKEQRSKNVAFTDVLDSQRLWSKR